MSRKNTKNGKYEKSTGKGNIKVDENATYDERSRARDGKSNRPSKPPRGGNSRGRVGKSDSTGRNHLSWYCRDPQLCNNVASINFYNPTGTPIEITGNYWKTVPGVMGLACVPTVGNSDSNISPVNRAARMLYDKITYKNSRNFSYTAADLMQYFIAYDSAISLHAFARRIYGVIMQYSALNRYLPKGILAAQRIDYEDMRDHLAELRYEINKMAVDLSGLCIPAGSTYTARHVWLNSNVFGDDTNLKAQFYVPFFQAYYKFLENAKLDGADTFAGSTTALVPILDEIEGWLTYDKLITYMRDLTESLLRSQTINEMSADVLKACEGAIWKWDFMEDNFTTALTYNEEVLEQINNAIAYGDVLYPEIHNYTDTATGIPYYTLETGSGVIEQSPSLNMMLRAKYQIQLKSYYSNDPDYKLYHLENESPFKYNYLLNAAQDNPSPGNVMLMSRFATLIQRDSSDGSIYSPYVCGSEILCKFIIVHATTEGQMATDMFDSFNMLWNNTQYTSISLSLPGQILNRISAFRCHPQFYLSDTAASSAENILTQHFSRVGDLRNYTTVDYLFIDRLHEVALVSMFTFD